MKVRSMRWGYDGGGIACGPVEGNTVVEIVVTHKQHNYFICASRMSEFMKITISPISVYDLLIESNHYDVDWESEYQKVNDVVTEEFDFELNEYDESMNTSEFALVLKLICMAMKEAYKPEDPTYEEAQAFIEEYIGDELADHKLMNFDEIFACEDNEDEYEDDEE